MFKFKQLFCLGFIFTLLLLPLNTLADAAATVVKTNEIGVVILSSGNSFAIGSDNQQRTLKRSSNILIGDTLVTGDNAQLQFRLNDNSQFSLNQNSKLILNDYKYEFNNKDNKSIIKLIQGGFRTVTGVIGSSNTDNYSIETPVAVIGVRGTDYTVVLSNNKLYIAVWKGVVTIKNKAGIFLFGLGQKNKYAVVNSDNTAPVGLSTIPIQCEQCSEKSKF